MPNSDVVSNRPLFEAVEGLRHVATVGVLPFAVVGNFKAPFNNLHALIAASKAAPWKHNDASAGHGSGPAMADLMTGQVTMSVPELNTTVAQLNNKAE